MSESIFLTGSYKRGTKIQPLDDIDMFYVMGYCRKKENERHIITDCDFEFGSEFLDKDDNISSIKVLELIKRELFKKYSNSEIKRNGEVVNVYLSTYEVGFDIVPAFYAKEEDYYLIPFGGGSTKWKKSNPKIDEKILEELNNKHNGKLKDIIRIIKYWFRKKKIKSLRSYHIESICYYMFKNKKYPILTYKEGLLHFYEYIGKEPYLSCLKSCPDPTNLSGDLSSGLSEDDIDKIINEAKRAKEYLENGVGEFVKYIEPELQ